MSNDPLETLLRQWNDANLGRFIEPTRPCPDGPSLATLYLHIVEGLELSPRQTDHVETCPRCLHVRERIESLAGTLQFVGSHRRTARPLVDDAGRIRRFGHLFRWTPATSALSRRRWVMGGSLAAAAVLIALLLLWPSGGTRPASAADLREVGFAPPLPLAAGWRNADDERLRQARQAVAEARVELDEALSAGQRDILDPWIAWTKLYRNLRVLGEWDEALEQMRAALAYAEAEDRKPARYSFYYVCLTDLGNTHSALGDYAAATSYHQKSFTVARDYQQWAHRSGLIADNTPRDYARAMVGTLVPRLWALRAYLKNTPAA